MEKCIKQIQNIYFYETMVQIQKPKSDKIP